MHMMQKLFKKKNPKTKPLRMSGVQKRFFVSYAVIVFAMMWCTTPVLAAGDPLAVVNNLSDFIFSSVIFSILTPKVIDKRNNLKTYYLRCFIAL